MFKSWATYTVTIRKNKKFSKKLNVKLSYLKYYSAQKFYTTDTFSDLNKISTLGKKKSHTLN